MKHIEEFALVNDKGVVEAGFTTRHAAAAVLDEHYTLADDLRIEDASLFDADGNRIKTPA